MTYLASNYSCFLFLGLFVEAVLFRKSFFPLFVGFAEIKKRNVHQHYGRKTFQQRKILISNYYHSIDKQTSVFLERTVHRKLSELLKMDGR